MTEKSADSPRDGKSCILLLNWQQWAFTLQCLESVIRLNHDNFTIVLCDNGSSDGSLDKVKAWAEGRLNIINDAPDAISEHAFPPSGKTVKYAYYEREAAERGGDKDAPEPRLVLIQNGGNVGFAAGNNVGLRYIMARGDYDYVWLLNNDTIVPPDSLSALVKHMDTNTDVGLCGSQVRYYETPDIVQACGGAAFNPWFATGTHIANSSPVSNIPDPSHVGQNLDYPLGASMCASRSFLERVGVMAEEYFLYFEEIDWTYRGKQYGFKTGYASDSIVYHRKGGSSGLNDTKPKLGTYSSFLLLNNRLTFTRKMWPWRLPTVYFGLLLVLAKSILLRRWDRVHMMLQPKFWIARTEAPRPPYKVR